MNQPLRYVAYLLAAAALLLAGLLWVQWPLREWVGAHNRLANDVGQVVFALFMAAAVTVASVGASHLTAHLGGTRTLLVRGVGCAGAAGSGLAAANEPAAIDASLKQPPQRLPQRRWLYATCVLPWAVLLLWGAVPAAWQAVSHWERFPETSTAGYWLLYLAVVVLAGLCAWFALRQLRTVQA
jgi:hypothetical protein